MKYLVTALLVALFSFGFVLMKNSNLKEESSVQEILIELGEEKPEHYFENLDPVKQKIGRQLVHNGRAKLPDGSSSSYISKFYVCTDCHNQEREDPVLSQSNPDARLPYVEEQGLKFLQATTFWGMVNRESWYNGDYVLKYGALVEPAHESLAESTQLCAKECSSGRYLEDWELEAILQYYWSIELTIKDLTLNSDELEFIEDAVNGEEEEQDAIELVKSRYLLASPATFFQDHVNGKKGIPGITGNPENGKKIYELSCQTCHREYGPSQLILDDSKFTFRKFKKNLKKESNFNLYHITRHGTYAEPGHRQYMPLYPMERLSNQQLEDLRAFMLAEAK